MRSRSILIGIVGMLLLGLAACGDDAPSTAESPAPGFTLPAADGTTVSLADYGDEPVLLFFHMADG